LEYLTRAIRKEEEIKVIQIGKEEVKQSLFANDMILFLKDQENLTEKCLNPSYTFSKVAGYKTNTQKSVAFVYILRKNIGKQPHLKYLKTMPRKKFNKGSERLAQ
jgi:hypothetical protein